MKNSNVIDNQFISSSPQETKSLGKSLAKELTGNEVLFLYGDLGSGKTSFIQGLAQALGVIDKVNSPTFNIMKVYKVQDNEKVSKFCHIDAYRLSSGSDLETLEIQELWQKPGVLTAIEWAGIVEDIAPAKYIKLIFSVTDSDNDDERNIEISRIGY